MRSGDGPGVGWKGKWSNGVGEKTFKPDNHFCEQDQDEENQVPGWEIHEKMLDEEESFYLLSDLSIEENLFFVIFELRLILVWVPA